MMSLDALYKLLNSDISFYEVFGVSEEATDSELKNAYRKLSRISHPDNYVNEDEKTQDKASWCSTKLNYMYDILTNESTRKYYAETGSVMETTESNKINSVTIKLDDPCVQSIFDRLPEKQVMHSNLSFLKVKPIHALLGETAHVNFTTGETVVNTDIVLSNHLIPKSVVTYNINQEDYKGSLTLVVDFTDQPKVDFDTETMTVTVHCTSANFEVKDGVLQKINLGGKKYPVSRFTNFNMELGKDCIIFKGAGFINHVTNITGDLIIRCRGLKNIFNENSFCSLFSESLEESTEAEEPTSNKIDSLVDISVAPPTRGRPRKNKETVTQLKIEKLTPRSPKTFVQVPEPTTKQVKETPKETPKEAPKEAPKETPKEEVITNPPNLKNSTPQDSQEVSTLFSEDLNPKELDKMLDNSKDTVPNKEEELEKYKQDIIASLTDSPKTYFDLALELDPTNLHETLLDLKNNNQINSHYYKIGEEGVTIYSIDKADEKHVKLVAKQMEIDFQADIEAYLLACKPLNASQCAILETLKESPMTLNTLYQKCSVSNTGIRGRISELVKQGYVKRYYSVPIGFTKSQTVYYYRTQDRKIMLDYIAESPRESSTYDGNLQKILDCLKDSPLYANQFKTLIPLNNIEEILLNLESRGYLGCVYQKIIKDGENGIYLYYNLHKDEKARERLVQNELVEVREMLNELNRKLVKNGSADTGRDNILRYLKNRVLTLNDLVNLLNINRNSAEAFILKLVKNDLLVSEEHEGTYFLTSPENKKAIPLAVAKFKTERDIWK